MLENLINLIYMQKRQLAVSVYDSIVCDGNFKLLRDIMFALAMEQQDMYISYGFGNMTNELLIQVMLNI